MKLRIASVDRDRAASRAQAGIPGQGPVRPGSPTQLRFAALRDSSDQTRRLATLGAHIGETAARTMATQRLARPRVARGVGGAVAQCVQTKRDKIIGEGFTGDDADTLKEIAGGWVRAWNLVTKLGVTPAYLQRVIGDLADRKDRFLALAALDAYYYPVARDLSNSAESFLGLLRKGLNSATVGRMCDEAVPAARSTILSLWNSPHIDNVGKFGKVFNHMPSLAAIVKANHAAHGPEIKRAIDWLHDRQTNVLVYLEQAAPTYDVINQLALEQLSDTPVGWLRHFAKDTPLGHEFYEKLTHNSYRVGHFSRHHTLRGLRPDAGVSESKTLMPVATTLDTVRVICGEFDKSLTAPSQAGMKADWTPPSGGGAKYRFATSVKEEVDQCYPRTGATISPAVAASLGRVYGLKNNWPD